MEVILLEKIHKLGTLGDKVNVAGGFARNYLIPHGKAVRATEANMASFEARRAELEKHMAELLAQAQARADKLKALDILKMEAQASEEGKLFGSIGTRDIAHALTTAGIEIAKSEVCLPNGALRYIGEYEVDIQLHGDVVQAIKISVISD
ncbi:MAG: 50S ribosomal protein L9 [Gammaproteobacteria bacterium]